MKIGIVGHGSIGQRHARNARSLGHQVLVFDPVSAKDVKFERDIYEQCDAVVVATPSMFHESGIRAAVERGKHVLVEKPISTAIGGLPAILKSAKDKNLVVMVGNNLRFHPCVIMAKSWIVDGHIGRPLWAHFICAQESSKKTYHEDGVILNWGAHEVDMAIHLLGPVAFVLKVSAEREIDGDVLADFVLLHESGCRSTFHLDYITPNEIRESWIAGTENNIGMEMLTRTACLGKFANAGPGSYDDDYLTEMTAFVGRIEGKNMRGATGDDGLETLKVLLEVRKMAGLV